MPLIRETAQLAVELAIGALVAAMVATAVVKAANNPAPPRAYECIVT